MQKQEAEQAAGKTFGYPLRPSSAGKCSRALAYELNEFEGHAKYQPDTKEPNVIRLLELGHDIERSILNVMRRAGIFEVRYGQQVVTFCRLPNGRLVEGSMDLVLMMGDQMKMLGDIKSKGVRWSQGRKSSWEDDDAKYESMTTLRKLGPSSYYAEDIEAFLAECRDSSIKSNVMQINGYARTPFILERGIDHAFILQYNKSNSMLREIRWPTSQKLADDANDKFIKVATAIYDGKGPESVPKDEVLGSFACAFCRFKTECWPELDPKKEFFKTLPPKQWPKDTSYLGEQGQRLEALFTDWQAGKKSETSLDGIEESMLKIMLDEGRENKRIKFSDGTVLEAKFLKTPRPGYKIRVGKV